MATVIYQFQEKLKNTEGITDLTLFNEQIPFDAREPDLIVEEDNYVLHDTSPAVNYQEIMEDFAMRCYLSKPDLAMSMGEPSHWFGGHNFWLTFVGVTAVLVVVLIPFLLFTTVRNTVDSDFNFRKLIQYCNSSTSGSINTIPTVLHCTNTVDSDFNFRKLIQFWKNC